MASRALPRRGTPRCGAPRRSCGRPGPAPRGLRARMGLLGVLAATVLAGACGSDGPKTLPSSSTTLPPTVSTPSTGPSVTTGPTTAPTVPADLDAAEVRLTTLVTGLDRPVDLATRSGDDTLYVAEQHTGEVRAIRNGELVARRVLDLGDQISTGNEQGLLGLAFSPDGRFLYVNLTDTNGDTRIREYAMGDGRADAASERDLLLIDQPYSNHNGGQLAFGPDGLLYIGTGDGGSGGDPEGHAQDLGSMLGKILRIDPRPGPNGAPYQVPADNPFVNRSGARPEIWLFGLRNPWRFSFDRATGDLWIGDVGQNLWEEVSVVPAGQGGRNLGWDRLEGTHRYEGDAPAGALAPVWEGSHDEGYASVTGGFVYRGTAIPNLVGAYVFADFGLSAPMAITVRNGALDRQRDLGIPLDGGIPSFGEDADGELYVLSMDGTVARIDPA